MSFLLEETTILMKFTPDLITEGKPKYLEKNLGAEKTSNKHKLPRCYSNSGNLGQDTLCHSTSYALQEMTSITNCIKLCELRVHVWYFMSNLNPINTSSFYVTILSVHVHIHLFDQLLIM